jgi:hypothetical protein
LHAHLLSSPTTPRQNEQQGWIQIQEEKMMTRRGVNLLAPILIALAFAMPVAASDAGTKDSKPTTATMEFLKPVTLGGIQLKPGSYHVVADETKVTIEQNGKMVAEAPVQWKDGNQKSRYSNIVSVGDQLKEIHFSGKMRYVVITG